MTEEQVVKWFCKEQKIMPYLQKFYYGIHPKTVSYENKEYKTKYLSFNEFIINLIKVHGMTDLFNTIIEEYCRVLRKDNEIPYVEYYSFKENMLIKFEKLNKRWNYFCKNNIKIDEDILKVDKVVKVESWGETRNIKIRNIDILSMRISGIVEIKEGCFNSSSSLYNILDGDKLIKLDFIIKRRKKIYHGSSKR